MTSRSKARAVGAFRQRLFMLVALLTLGVFMLVIWSGWLWAQGPPTRWIRLTDGTEVSLATITYGRQHEYYTGKPWQKLLDRVLPPTVSKPWRPALPIHTFQSPHGDQLVFWVRRRHPTTPYRNINRVTPTDGQDVDGPYYWETAVSQSPSSGETLTAWATPVFPRRATRVGLRFWNYAGNEVCLGQVTGPNPVPYHYPQWHPQPLPVTSSDGDLQVTLKQLLTGVFEDEPSRIAPGAGDAATWLSFDVAQPGKPAIDWIPTDLTFTDATGNVRTEQWNPAGERSTSLRGSVNGLLTAGEAAWKIRAEFARSKVFAPDEMWQLKHLAVPPLDRATAHHESITIHGAHLALTRVYSQPPERTHTFIIYSVKVSNLAPDWRVDLVRAVTPQGRAVKAFGVGGQAYWEFEPHTGPNRDYRFSVYAPIGVRSLDLTFALQRSRFVEFTVAPRRANTSTSKPAPVSH